MIPGIAILIIVMCLFIVPMLMRASDTLPHDIREAWRDGFRKASAGEVADHEKTTLSEGTGGERNEGGKGGVSAPDGSEPRP